MFIDLPSGKIDQKSAEFSKLQAAAQSRLEEILMFSEARLGARLKRHIALSKLNALLSFYGWAIQRDGQMFEVRVRGEPVDLKNDDTPKHPLGSIEDLNEQARITYTETGKLVDPTTGRRLPNSKRHRFGIV
ncbi:hypothetical protein K3X13_10850 [Aliiroseovarius crassostreae]|uniref:hypothetical protein n=1 Tax=Aliiroseovarius crassostreae TaxID=154981 RepID=UPI00220E9078|nr:hypothetical protein [Aliiroseovarius crassostreae]UWP91557.1 hypothetical protein K3X13_10850 [Aliiroseovarius crassostreae]